MAAVVAEAQGLWLGSCRRKAALRGRGKRGRLRRYRSLLLIPTSSRPPPRARLHLRRTLPSSRLHVPSFPGSFDGGAGAGAWGGYQIGMRLRAGQRPSCLGCMGSGSIQPEGKATFVCVYVCEGKRRLPKTADAEGSGEGQCGRAARARGAAWRGTASPHSTSVLVQTRGRRVLRPDDSD